MSGHVIYASTAMFIPHPVAIEAIAAIEALMEGRDTRQRDAEYWKARYDGAITLERKRNAETEAELARVREADRLTSFGGLTECPKCKVFTDMDRHWCYPLPGGAFCMGFKDALAAGKGEGEK